MHQSTYAVTVNHDCMIAMRALEVQLWYFVFRIEHLCGQFRDTTACMSRRKKNRIIFIQKSSNTITCSFKSTHTPQIFLESIMQCKKILIGLLEYLLPSLSIFVFYLVCLTHFHFFVLLHLYLKCGMFSVF